MKVSQTELLHYQLQALLRENTFQDLEYLGLRNGEHWYRIDSNELPISSIIDIEEV